MPSSHSLVDRRVVLRSLLGGTAATGATLLGSSPAEAFLRFRQQIDEAPEAALRSLSAAQAEILAAAAERILPRTDTPGARDAEVHLFLDRLLAGWFLEPERDAFLGGLDDLDRTSRERFEKPFAELEDARQDALLAELEDEAFAARQGQPWALQPETVEPPMLAGQAFFDVLRWATLVGYYTSEAGMREELGYRVVPGRYDGCEEPADEADEDAARA